MHILSNIWVKIILAVGLVGGGAVGVSTVLNNKSADSESAASSSSSKKESKKESSKPAEKALTSEEKLLVLMDNQKSTVAISAEQLRNGSFVPTVTGSNGQPQPVSNISAELLPKTDDVKSVLAATPDKSAKLFKVDPNTGGFITFFLLESNKATIFGSQNISGFDYNKTVNDTTFAVSMSNEEMTKYYEANKDKLNSLVSKITVTDSKKKNTNNKASNDSSESSKQESDPKEAATSANKSASELPIREQQALALMALPSKMYSDYGDITTDMILAGHAPANGTIVDKLESVDFDGIQIKQDGNKNLLYLANVAVPDSLKNPPLYILSYFIIDGDNVTYKSQGMRVSGAEQEANSTVEGVSSLQALYNKYKDDPKFEQMKNKVK